MITLYALKQSRAYRIAWLLELLGLEYRAEVIARDAETALAPDSLRRIHPLGKSPLIDDNGLVLAESGAIIEYLMTRYGQETALKPPVDSPIYPDYLFWLHYAEGSLMPLLVMSLVFRKIETRKMPFFVKPIARKISDGVRASFLNPQLKRHLEFVESKLAGRAWLLGEKISAADVMMSFPLQAAVSRTALDLPHIAAYVRRIEADPAWQRASERLGKLELL
ncbi:glutathione S-transferase [Vandammella animalimorsus]|uniref:Glutathione S-transferase n=1 Tax=Vandammella animalimorsus TaxID=2029117 RepID=A0A2A2T7J0_9BURK|nr:glutathione S-transferase [Vandammella animalimorsus]PAT32753.1 glutathione S-transferase [Vandammella animalimorsus]PAX17784.1 glutathione S-transferase [Vandammella animalimorsus]PAX19938.1 glutathione S-transferase [Vandammella animalimorsus]